jgi:TM2 domain-containing membrane protein YozV
MNVMEQIMYCKNCGAPIENNSAFCAKCGAGQNVTSANVPVPSGAQKSKLVAGLLGIFVGGFGIHRFYLGYIGMGITQIIVTFVTCGIGSLWGFIEGILILVGNINTDSEGRPLGD